MAYAELCRIQSSFFVFYFFLPYAELCRRVLARPIQTVRVLAMLLGWLQPGPIVTANLDAQRPRPLAMAKGAGADHGQYGKWQWPWTLPMTAELAACHGNGNDRWTWPLAMWPSTAITRASGRKGGISPARWRGRQASRLIGFSICANSMLSEAEWSGNFAQQVMRLAEQASDEATSR